MSLFFDIFKLAKGDSTDKVTNDVWQDRLSKCRECITDGEWTVSEIGRCKLCGCFVNQKTKYKDESCPKGEWDSQ